MRLLKTGKCHKGTYEKTHEERICAIFAAGNALRTVPEDQRNDEHRHCLRSSKDQVRPDSSAVRAFKRRLERAAVDVGAILLTGERRDSADSAGSFTSNLC